MPDPNFPPVTIKKIGGAVTLKVSNPNSPQSVSGTADEYVDVTKLPIHTFSFTTIAPQNTLGLPAATDQHYYAIDGTIHNNNDNPPTLYQVNIELWQDGNRLLLALIPSEAPGQISNADKYFLYKFQLVAA